MFMHLERYKFECLTSILNNEKLADENTNDNSDKQIVVKELCKDVHLLPFEFTAIQKVKNL
jgi:hypothetical protein